MTLALLTLFAALSVAAVAGWFAIVGIMTIYAGAPMYAALVMGVVLEFAKLITISWVYRNWEIASWKLKLPLIYFTLALMSATSIGVYGFLSKAHLEQGASTVNNGAKVEQIEQQIRREQSAILSAEKTITQLDATLDSYLGKDRADRSVVIRQRQAPQRKELQTVISESQKKINTLNDEKFVLQSEVRKLQLEVGPIRYIAELMYGTEGNTEKNIEAAVRIFTLLIVSTLDPLAVILLIAANHSLLRLRNEKEKETKAEEHGRSNNVHSNNAYPDEANAPSSQVVHQPSFTHVEDQPKIDDVPQTSKTPEAEIHVPISTEAVEVLSEKEKAPEVVDSKNVVPVTNKDQHDGDSETHQEPSERYKGDAISEISPKDVNFFLQPRHSAISSPKPTRVTIDPQVSEMGYDNDVVRELRGSGPHFVPLKIIESSNTVPKNIKILNWLDEFKRT